MPSIKREKIRKTCFVNETKNSNFTTATVLYSKKIGKIYNYTISTGKHRFILVYVLVI
jgi:hypothetical protein